MVGCGGDRAFRAFVLGARPGQKRVPANPGESSGVPAVTALEVASWPTIWRHRTIRALARRRVAAPDCKVTATACSPKPRWRAAVGRPYRARRRREIRFHPGVGAAVALRALSFVPLPRRSYSRPRGGSTMAPRQSLVTRPATPPPIAVCTLPPASPPCLWMLVGRHGHCAAARPRSGSGQRYIPRGRLAHTLAQSIRAHVGGRGSRRGGTRWMKRQVVRPRPPCSSPRPTTAISGRSCSSD